MMTLPSAREVASLATLDAVSSVRRARLRTERLGLAKREQTVAGRWTAQELDESLLAEQQAHWSACWKTWSAEGGALREAKSLRRDKDLLSEMATLLAGRRAQLQAAADQLELDLRDWARRQHGADALAESLLARRRVLATGLDRAAERQRDEETLMTRAATRSAASAAERSAGHR